MFQAKWVEIMAKRIGPAVEPWGSLQDVEDEQEFPVELPGLVLDKCEEKKSEAEPERHLRFS